MSKKIEHPSQLQLPFLDDARERCAKIFTLSAYRHGIDEKVDAADLQKKEAERKILDRVLERAERLSWYK